MEQEMTVFTVQRGNNIHVINKGAKSEVGIVHITGSKFRNDYDDREYSHLVNAVNSLITHKTVV